MQKTIHKKAIVVPTILITLLVILAIGGIGFYLYKTDRLPFDVGSDFIYCFDYEFTCCGEHLESTFQENWGVLQGDIFTCANSANRCYVTFTGSSSVSLWKAPSISGCSWENPLIGARGYQCDGGYRLGDNVAQDIQGGEVLYLDTSIDFTTRPYQIRVETYKDRLAYCGRAACDGGETGIPVSGADACTFVTDNSIYSPSGAIISEVDSGSISYTVPESECRLAFQSGDRHICGDKTEECAYDTDCGGHTYGNYECNARTLQQYGCKQLDDPNSAVDYALGWVLNQDLSYTASRCEIISATPVQCCGDTDCGSSAVCDNNPGSSTAWTCQEPEDVECDEDYDCGVSKVCDWVDKKIVSPVCNNNHCGYDETPVECCNDANCPPDYYCGVDKTCKESVNPKQACAYACCDNEPGYVDKPCVAGQTCCDDNTCHTQCGGCPAGFKECDGGECRTDCGGGKKTECEEDGGKWVEIEEDCTWFQETFQGCKDTTTGICRIPKTPILAIVVLIFGFLMILGGIFALKESEVQFPVIFFGAILAIIAILWLILAGGGYL